MPGLLSNRSHNPGVERYVLESPDPLPTGKAAVKPEFQTS
jgi:hypothetical protein